MDPTNFRLASADTESTGRSCAASEKSRTDGTQTANTCHDRIEERFPHHEGSSYRRPCHRCQYRRQCSCRATWMGVQKACAALPNSLVHSPTDLTATSLHMSVAPPKEHLINLPDTHSILRTTRPEYILSFQHSLTNGWDYDRGVV